MRRLIRLLIPLTLIVAIIGPGCYTMIWHPKDETSHRKVDQLSDCTSCHVEYGSYPYGYYYDPYPDYWWDHPGYSAYYAYPWWWSYYQYPYLDGNYDQGESSLRGTQFDQREAVYIPPPPYSLPDNYKVEIPILPPSYNNPQNNNGGTTGQSRPGSGSDVINPPTRSREDNGSVGSGKATRQNTKASPTRSRGSQPVPKPKPDEGQPDNNNQNPPPPDSLNDEG